MRYHRTMCDYDSNKLYKLRVKAIILGRSNCGWGIEHNRIGIDKRNSQKIWMWENG